MKKVVSGYITKILLSVIITLSILIFGNINQKNKKIVKKYMFENNFEFMSFNKWYSSFTKYKPKNEEPVFLDAFSYYSKEKYENGEKYTINENEVVKPFSSGIVVYIGQKDNYGNSVIIQGSDGFDILYGNLDNVKVKMYDFLKKSDIIAETSSSDLYIEISKDGKYYTYEEYLKNK